MVTLRRDRQRHHVERGEQEVWLTFSAAERDDALADGFGDLEILNEDRLPPGAGAGVPLQRHHDAEIVTYVHEGALAYEDSTGRSGVLRTGEFERITAGRGMRHSESNASSTGWAHCFQMWLRPSQAGLPPSREQKRFSAAQRRGALRVIASPDGQNGSMRLHQDAFIYSALLDAGKRVAHELSRGRCAWIHVVRGQLTLDDVVLSRGDGAGVTSDRAVSLIARSESEILLVDLAAALPGRRRGHGLPA